MLNFEPVLSKEFILTFIIIGKEFNMLIIPSHNYKVHSYYTDRLGIKLCT